MGAKDISKTMTLKDNVTSPLKKISAGTVEYKKNLKDLKATASDTWGSIKTGVKAAGVVVAAVGIAGAIGITKLSIEAIKAGSNFEEMQSKFDTVFGATAEQAESWSASFRNAVGGSRVEIKGMLADSQDMLTGFGASTEEGLRLSTMFQSLGTDLASFGNLQGGASEGVERLRKGLLGEHENLKAMGIIINETTLAQELSAKGDKRKLKELSELEKIQLRYEIAVKQSKNAIGDAEKTSGSFANRMRDLKGIAKDSLTEMGVKFLPVVTKGLNGLTSELQKRMPEIMSGVAGIAEGVQAWTDAGGIERMIDGVGKVADGIKSVWDFSKETYNFFRDNWSTIEPVLWGIAAGYTALKVAQMGAAAWTTIMTIKQWALNGAMLANPVGLVIGLIAIGIAAVVTAGIFLIRNWDNIQLAGKKVWNGIVSGVEWGVNAYISYINLLIDGALGGINFLIRQLNKVRSDDNQIGEIEFGIKKVDFGAAKFDTSGQEFDWRLGKKKEDSPDDIIAQMNAEQKKADSKQQQRIESQTNLATSLDANTAATKDNTKATKAALLDKSTSTDIADSLLGRIERHIWST